MLPITENTADPIDLGKEKENLRSIMRACQSAIWAIEKSELWKPRELPEEVHRVFREVLATWHAIFGNEKFWILCVRSGMPHTWPHHAIQVGEKVFLDPRTGHLMMLKPDRRTETVTMPLDGFTWHIVSIRPSLLIGQSAMLLEEHTRWKDAFVYT